MLRANIIHFQVCILCLSKTFEEKVVFKTYFYRKIIYSEFTFIAKTNVGLVIGFSFLQFILSCGSLLGKCVTIILSKYLKYQYFGFICIQPYENYNLKLYKIQACIHMYYLHFWKSISYISLNLPVQSCIGLCSNFLNNSLYRATFNNFHQYLFWNFKCYWSSTQYTFKNVLHFLEHS